MSNPEKSGCLPRFLQIFRAKENEYQEKQRFVTFYSSLINNNILPNGNLSTRKIIFSEYKRYVAALQAKNTHRASTAKITEFEQLWRAIHKNSKHAQISEREFYDQFGVSIVRYLDTSLTSLPNKR